MLKRALTSHLFPRLLIVSFLLLMVCTIFIHINDYGVSVDEPLQNSYGHYDLAWYLSLGKDQSFLHYRTNLYMPEHGPFFEGLVAIAQQLFGRELTTRAIVTGLAGVTGVVAIMLCGYVLGENGWPWSLDSSCGCIPAISGRCGTTQKTLRWPLP